MTIERSKRTFSPVRMADVARSLLDASALCAISTVSPRCGAHVNTAYFAWSADLRVVWLSDPTARHSRNLATHRTVAVAVFDARQVWGQPDRGIQLVGIAGEAVGAARPDAERLYADRFAGFTADGFAGYALYVFRPRRVKLFDEPAFGSGVFVTAKVRADGRLTWERTEISRPS